MGKGHKGSFSLPPMAPPMLDSQYAANGYIILSNGQLYIFGIVITTGTGNDAVLKRVGKLAPNSGDDFFHKISILCNSISKHADAAADDVLVF